MYKVSEVAEMLAIEKVKIFEALIVHDEVLSPHVVKERHLSYITEDGVKELERLIFGIEPELEEKIIVEVQEDDETLDNDYLDEYINRNSQKKDELKKEIIDLKRQINLLDKELRMKDEAILHYQNIFEEDLKWILDIETKIQHERSLLKAEPVEEKKNGFFGLLKK